MIVADCKVYAEVVRSQKNEAESVNLLTLEEIHLIVTLCTNVLPSSVPKTELVCPLIFTFLPIS